jgi:hypothetical protein
MKGHTAWVLVFSVLIASIDLNISSAAVVNWCHVNLRSYGAYFRSSFIYWNK